MPNTVLGTGNTTVPRQTHLALLEFSLREETVTQISKVPKEIQISFLKDPLKVIEFPTDVS